MAERASKRLAALRAYEELSLKESLCLREENYEGLLATQGKMKLLMDGLLALRGQALGPGEAGEYDACLERLRAAEAANAALLAERMAGNREQFRALSKSASSGVGALRAYGRPEQGVAERPANLKDRA